MRPMNRSVPRGMPEGAAKFDKRTIKRLLTYLNGHKLALAFVVVCIILSAVASVSSSLFLRTLIDDHIKPMLTNQSEDFSGLLLIILMMAGIYLVGILATLFYNRVMAVITQGTLKKIRDDMFRKMQQLPIRYFDTHAHGDIMSHYTNDADTLRQMISQGLPQLFSSLISITSVFISMLILSVWLTLFVVLFSAVMLTIMGKVVGRSGKYFMQQQRSIGKVNGYIEEMINGQKVVKVFCHEQKAREGFDALNDELCENATKAHAYVNIVMPLMNSMGYLLYVLIAIFGGLCAIAHLPNLTLTGWSAAGLTLGSIVSFLTLSRNFVMPIGHISQQLNSIVMALAGASRIFEMLDEEPEVNDGYVTLVNARYDGDTLTETDESTSIWAWKHPHKADGTVTYTRVEGRVVLDDVDFSYVPEKPVLHNVSLCAEPGQKIAFVGATGAGKTTITNLINRFYDIADGKIRYDGININKICKQDLRRSLGIVLQDVNLFTGTVMENLRYGRLDATDEECIAAAQLAGADSFIRMLPNGYDTVLEGDGSGLSQGQRQLISIARAAVADPPVMILDEATSSIDTRTEAIVQQGMDALMTGRTVFVIAHRLSTVKNADMILVLDGGRIIERGNHQELIQQKGRYYQLYTGAFELD